jgi:hypothetical protein
VIFQSPIGNYQQMKREVKFTHGRDISVINCSPGLFINHFGATNFCESRFADLP